MIWRRARSYSPRHRPSRTSCDRTPSARSARTSTRSRTRIALKVGRGEQRSAPHRARLHREAQALARLSHPSVVTVFDVGDLDDDTYVAMELVDGESLRDWLKQPRTWREVVRVIVAAGRGL